MSESPFDSQAGLPVLPEVLTAMQPYWKRIHSSPSALHRQGLMARDALVKAKEQFAAFLGAESADEILFTSSGTESANLAVKGTAWASQRLGKHIVASRIEHPSVLRSLEFLGQQGFSFTLVPVDKHGLISPKDVAQALRKDTILICLHHANHDIGTIQPVKEVVDVAAGAGIPVFVDATTSGGWLNIDVKELGASMLSLSPHRFHGPKGVGVLYRNRRAPLQPLIHGGRQEQDLRAGTENLPAIVGAGLAAELAYREAEARQRKTRRWQRKLWDGLAKSVSHIGLHGPELGPNRLSTNLNFSVEFVEGEGLVLMSDVRGIALASGSSCISKSLQASPVLQALGVPKSLAQANVLLTLGCQHMEEELDYFLDTFPGIVEKLRSMSPTWDAFKSGVTKSLL